MGGHLINSAWNYLSELGIFTVGTIGIVSAIGFIARSFFNSWLSNKSAEYKMSLDKELETFKISMQSQTEIFKSDLQLKATEHQIKYSKLHNDRAETIRELYKKISLMEHSMRDAFNVVQLTADKPKEEKVKLAAQRFNETMEYFDCNRIFFSELVCDKIDELTSKLRETWNEFTSYDLHLEELSHLPDFRKEQIGVWRKCWDTIKTDINDINRDLEKEFRILLGVEN